MHPTNTKLLTQIRDLTPWTMSWSNVPDYFSAAEFHALARCVGHDSYKKVHVEWEKMSTFSRIQSGSWLWCHIIREQVHAVQVTCCHSVFPPKIYKICNDMCRMCAFTHWWVVWTRVFILHVVWNRVQKWSLTWWLDSSKDLKPVRPWAECDFNAERWIWFDTQYINATSHNNVKCAANPSLC